jgi:hypothetical protein
MAVRLSALRTRRTLLPRNIIILMFLVLISVILYYSEVYTILDEIGLYVVIIKF